MPPRLPDAASGGATAALAFLILCGFAVSTTVSRAQEAQSSTPQESASQEEAVPEGEAEVSGEAREGQSFAYSVSISGDFKEELGTLLREVSQLERQAERAPLTAAALAARVESDMERLRAVLRSEGYYAGEVDSEIDIEERPVAIRIEVTTGTRFTLASYQISYQGAPPPEGVRREIAEAGGRLGAPARAENLNNEEKRLVVRLRNRGYPFAKVADKKYTVDHAAESMAAEIVLEAGPRADFGEMSIEGLEDVRADHAERVAAWFPGERYDPRRVERLRQDLSRTGLFESVLVEPAGEVGSDGRLPVTVTVIERPHRSIGGGVAYSSADGFSVSAFWEHRNLFERGERLRLDADFSLTRQEATAEFRKPYFLQHNQSLLLNAAVVRQQDEAFDELSTTLYGGVERTYGDHWSLSAGASLELIRITEDGLTRDYGLVGFPVTLGYDSRDDALDPTKGFTLSATTTPYFGVSGDAEKFWVNEIKGSAYLSLDADDNFVLAARARLGSILGSTRSELPANKRFYSGGGGSVRGFEFRSVGPLDSSDDPIGGRSVVEGGLELRVRLTEEIGIVPFVEGGQVSTSSYPDLKEEVLWAAGLGFRYYTAIGPVRLDFAFPINGRPVDDTFQFYVSIGQAF
ncbi:MAG: autotransporter assembly complex family protein [Rhodovibrionaceae bacterium]